MVTTVNLDKEILAVMRAMNSRHGVVGHDLADVEGELLSAGVSYDDCELEAAITELIKSERIVVHHWREKKDSRHYCIAVGSLL